MFLLAAVHPHGNHLRHLGLTLSLSAKSLAISLSTSHLCRLWFRATASPSFLKDRVWVSVSCFREIVYQEKGGRNVVLKNITSLEF